MLFSLPFVTVVVVVVILFLNNLRRWLVNVVLITFQAPNTTSFKVYIDNYLWKQGISNQHSANQTLATKKNMQRSIWQNSSEAARTLGWATGAGGSTRNASSSRFAPQLVLLVSPLECVTQALASSHANYYKDLKINPPERKCDCYLKRSIWRKFERLQTMFWCFSIVL